MKLDMSFKRVILVIAILLEIGSISLQAQTGFQQTQSFYLKKCRALDHHPHIKRAQEVFEKIRAVSDRTGKRWPQLVMIQKKNAFCQGIAAQALPDGSVLITEELLDLVYQDVTTSIGDARLAFVIGHELSHLAKDDFWHAQAFYAVKNFTHEKSEENHVLQYLLQCCVKTALSSTSQAFVSNVLQARELQADAYGILYMTMAGYNPHVILEYNGLSFFEHYGQQMSGQLVYSQSHPTPQIRAKFLKTQFQHVVTELSFFHWGTRLYQLGHYPQAIAMLTHFSQYFPSQEIFNNLGLSYYQQGRQQLSGCPNLPALDFQLMTVIQEQTSADELITRRSMPFCYQNQGNSLLQKASDYLQQAVKMNPAQLRTHINLSTVWILMGRYTQALGELDYVLSQSPEHPEALNNKAVALYLYGKKEGLATKNRAIALLKSIPTTAPNGQQVQDNLTLLHPDPEPDLNIVETGVNTQKKSSPNIDMSFLPDSPLPLGKMNTSTAKRLREIPLKREFEMNTFQGILYSDPAQKILVTIDDQGDYHIAFLEISLPQPWSQDFLQTRLGNPLRKVRNMHSETWIYADFALDIQQGQATTLLYFLPD